MPKVGVLTAGGLAPCLSSALGYLIELYTVGVGAPPLCRAMANAVPLSAFHSAPPPPAPFDAVTTHRD